MKGKQKFLMVIYLVLTLLLVLYPCQAAATQVPGEFKIGVIYSLTGGGSAVGTTQLDGAELAAKEVNARGGLNVGGILVPVRLLVRDDETEPDVAIRRYRELTGEGVRVIVGGTFGHISTAYNVQAQDGQTFVMATNGIEEKCHRKENKAPYFLSSLGATDAVGRICADYVARTYEPKHVILCLPDYSYGHGANKGAMTVFEGKYPQIKVETLWTPVGTPDFTSYILRLKDSKPDVVMMGQWGDDAIGIVKQAHELGLHEDTIVFYNSINAALALGIPPEAVEGMAMGIWLYHDLSDFLKEKDPETVRAMEELTEVWRAEYGEPPDVMAVYAYIGMRETLRAIELAGGTDPKAMYQALMENPEFMSVKGPAHWREDGRPFYKYAKFIGTGKGADERADRFDYAKVTDAYEGEQLVLPLTEMGY